MTDTYIDIHKDRQIDEQINHTSKPRELQDNNIWQQHLIPPLSKNANNTLTMYSRKCEIYCKASYTIDHYFKGDMEHDQLTSSNNRHVHFSL